MNTLIIFAAAYLYLLVILLFVVTFLMIDSTKKRDMLKLAILVFPLCLMIALITNVIIPSPRPFVVGHFEPLIPASTDNGFPSDHVLLSMALAAVAFIVNRKMGIFLLILATIVGIGRVLAQVHHPLDVIGSTIIALTTTYLVNRYLVDKLPEHLPWKKGNESMSHLN